MLTALKAAWCQGFDEAALADIGMTGSDGFDLIRRVRQLADPTLRDVPAAALTAYARAEDRMKALQAGFQLHLAKPVDPAELIVAIARWPGVGPVTLDNPIR